MYGCQIRMLIGARNTPVNSEGLYAENSDVQILTKYLQYNDAWFISGCVKS